MKLTSDGYILKVIKSTYYKTLNITCSLVLKRLPDGRKTKLNIITKGQ